MIIIALVFALLIVLKNKIKAPIKTPNVSPTTIENSARMSFTGHAAERGITELSLQPNNGFISGKISVTGKAQGYMFEGSFPVTVVTPVGTVLLQTNASVKGSADWMTTEPVPFTFTIDTTRLPNGQASILLSQDDTSGGESKTPLKTLEIPVFIQN